MERLEWKVLCVVVTLFQACVWQSECSVASGEVIHTSGFVELESKKPPGKFVSGGARDTQSFSETTFSSLDAGKNIRDDSVGYAAEWEYDGMDVNDIKQSTQTAPRTSKSTIRKQSGKFPTRQLGPGTWHDNAGNWWVFGGHGSSGKILKQNNDTQHFVNDLWLYSPDQLSSPSSPDINKKSYTWKLVFRPDTTNESPYSSFPEELDFPLLCGSESSKHIALFGDHRSVARAPEQNRNSPFSEDNVVWLFDVPKKFLNELSMQQQQEPKKHVAEEKPALWTSYICCDECLPDGNTTFEFCPQFSLDPIAWCGQDSLMMLQLVLTTTDPNSNHIDKHSNIIPEEAIKEDNLVNITTTTLTMQKPENIPQELTRDKINGSQKGDKDTNRGSPGISHPSSITSSNYLMAQHKSAQYAEVLPQNVGKAAKNDKNGEKKSNGDKDGSPSITNNVNPRSSLNWWKFDLVSTEWIKMPEVSIGRELMHQIRNENCRVVSSLEMVYILCPTKGNLLDRDVLLFDQRKASVQLLGRIHLNNAFADKKVWQLGRSVFHALQSDNQTIIFLAYHKLLDLWIHHHSSNRLYPVENVWKGFSLHAFQSVTSFYKLSVSLPIPFLSSSLSKNESHKPQEHHSNEKNETTVYSFFMLNPRSKFHNFEDSSMPAHFRIRIVPDREVFLPARDATYLAPSLASTQANDKSAPQKEKNQNDENFFMSLPMMDEPLRPLVKEEKHSEKLEGITSPLQKLAPSSQKLRNPDSMELHRSTKYRTDNIKSAKKDFHKKHQRILGIKSVTNNITSDQVHEQDTPPLILLSTGNNSTLASGIESTHKMQETVEPPPSSFPSLDKPKYTNELEKSVRRSSPQLLFPSTGKRALIPQKLQRAGNVEQEERILMNADRRKSEIMTRQLQTNASFVEYPSRSDDHGEAVFTSGFMSTNTTTTTPSASTWLDATLNGTRAVGQVAPDVRKNQPQQQKLESAGKSLAEAGSERPVKLSNSTFSFSNFFGNMSATPASPLSLPLLTTGSARKVTTHNMFTVSPAIHNDHPQENNATINNLLNPAKLQKVKVDSQKSDFTTSESSRSTEEVGQEDVDSPLKSMTYGSSEIVVEHSNDILMLGEEGNFSGDTGYGPTVFFASTLTFFASIGVVLFIRRCVKCPPSRESVLLKEPPPLHYAVIPDDFSFHVPIV